MAWNNTGLMGKEADLPNGHPIQKVTEGEHRFDGASGPNPCQEHPPRPSV